MLILLVQFSSRGYLILSYLGFRAATIARVLRLMHALFKRYRYLEHSDELWAEIKVVLDAVHDPLLGVAKKSSDVCCTLRYCLAGVLTFYA